MTTSERKAGKHERIRELLNNLRASQPEPMVREQPWFAEVLEIPRLRSSGLVDTSSKIDGAELM